MKIADSNILMASTRTFMKKNEEKEVLRAWIDPQGQENSGDRISISQESKRCLCGKEADDDGVETGTGSSHVTTLKELLVEVLSGRKVEILDVSMLQNNPESENEGDDRVQNENPPEEEKVGWGVEYSRHDTVYEREDVDFVAAGIIRSEDGKEIDFSLRLDMEREFISHESLNFRAGDALLMDPLVINFDGKAAELSDMAFTFDLDSDGVEETLPMIRQGSGFLALDLNSDGIVTNGNELFGPRTGNGFSELSEYDQDVNNWIDEDDPVYDQLSVWTINEQGTASLSSLRERDIGALYLGNLASKFDLRGNSNELMGQVSKSGIFLSENGTRGTIQQLDLVI
jgi:hypothetical protein